jgi:DNA polymerase-3 subunit delta'
MKTPLPWQDTLWDGLISRFRAGSLPHALLFSGDVGVGKATLAEALIHGLLCQSPAEKGTACGQCQSCGLLAAGTHPDLLWLEPEEPGKAIPVDRIRAVGNFLALKGQYGGRQIVFINPAEAMNRHAANSLLKTLEEPTEDALLILISNQPSLLLPTIRSRCQQLVFPRPEAQVSETWLQAQIAGGEKGASESINIEDLLALSNGAPLAAKALHETGGLAVRRELANQWAGVAQGKVDPLACAKQWSELGLPKATQWLSSWVMDLIRLKSGGNPAVITNGDLSPQLQKLVAGLELQRLFAYLQQITETARWANGQLNAQSAMEDLMVNWGRLRRR